jgi:FKBP-type peptidyl-prolyl cis-trans isomerase 2
MVVEVKADAVLVDFNHPLAGLDLHFEGVVVGVSA